MISVVVFVSDLQELDSVTQRTVSVLFLVCPRSVLSGCLVDISIIHEVFLDYLSDNKL